MIVLININSFVHIQHNPIQCRMPFLKYIMTSESAHKEALAFCGCERDRKRERDRDRQMVKFVVGIEMESETNCTYSLYQCQALVINT